MTRPPRARRGRPLVGWLALLLVLPAVAGCGRPYGHLSGQVLYKGQPVPGGWVTFRPADPKENTVTAPIEPDGRYEATLPVGDVAIAVDNRELAPPPDPLGPIVPPGAQLPPEAQPKGGAAGPPKGDRAKPRGNYVAIPKKYYNTDTSGLQYTVKKGSDTFPIELQE